MNIQRWLSTATKEIRFAPDRSAVQDELRAHYDDRVETLLARGMSECEAKNAAVAAMGDPQEIAAELGRIHSPWWGYLWKASRWAVLLATIILALSLLTAANRSEFPLHDFYAPYIPQVGDTFVSAYNRTSTVQTVWRLKGSASFGGYRFTIPCAYLEHGESFTAKNGDSFPTYDTLHLYLKASTLRFWESASTDQTLLLQGPATDSEGCQYPGFYYHPSLYMYDAPLLICQSRAGLPGVTWYLVELNLPGAAVPDWVDIPVGYGGETIRVNLEKGVVS